MSIQPGIHHNLSIEEYHLDLAISKTTIHRFYKSSSPAHFKAYKEKEKDSLRFGSILHMAVLEPETYQGKVIVTPASVLAKNGARSGNKWKEWKADQGELGKEILTPGEKINLDYAIEELFQRPYNNEAAELLSSGLSEASFFWNDFDTTVPMKCRPDKLPGNEIAVDLKTAASAEVNEFGKQAANFKYHWSAAITLAGISEVTKKLHRDYRYVVIEKEEPYGVMVYRIEDEDIDMAQSQVSHVMKKLVACIQEDRWPNFIDGTHSLKLPYWERKQFEKELMGEEVYD